MRLEWSCRATCVANDQRDACPDMICWEHDKDCILLSCDSKAKSLPNRLADAIAANLCTCNGLGSESCQSAELELPQFVDEVLLPGYSGDAMRVKHRGKAMP